MEPVEVASLAADPSFVLPDSHILTFDSKDDGGTHDHCPHAVKCFDALPLSAELDFEPAMQPQNATALLLHRSRSYGVRVFL